MAMEPTKEDLKAMTTIQHVLTWAGVDGEFATGLAGAFGVQPGEPLRVLAAIDEDDVADIKKTLKIAEAKLSPAQKGKVDVAWKTARIAAGVMMSSEASAEKAEAELKRESRRWRSSVPRPKRP